jgi:hypothetical protein
MSNKSSFQGLTLNSRNATVLDMAKLSPKQIADWFRSQAKQFNKMADTVEATFKLQPAARGKQIEETGDAELIAVPEAGTVTAQQFEDEVRKKTGRLKGLAERLNTSEDTLRGLLHPASRVHVASRGWLEVQE